MFFSSVFWCPLRFLRKNNVLLVFSPICFLAGSLIIHVICIYLRILESNTISNVWCSCRLTLIPRVSLVEHELLTIPEFCCSKFSFFFVWIIVCPFDIGQCQLYFNVCLWLPLLLSSNFFLYLLFAVWMPSRTIQLHIINRYHILSVFFHN
jgi:hypothetical protein